jgi:hypothetical protein
MISVGSRSTAPGNAADALTLRREQVSGPEALVLESANLARATFTPTIAGANVLRLSSFDDATTTAPAQTAGVLTKSEFIVTPQSLCCWI